MKVFLCSVCLLFFTGLLRAQDYCSLIVHVVDHCGADIRIPKPVIVEEQDGRKIERRYTAGGVRFCDLGILPVIVTVGYPGCNQTIVRDIPLGSGRTTTLRVFDNAEACQMYHSNIVPPPGCTFLFRFVDSQREPIRSVSLSLRSPFEETLRGDSFGRIRLRILLREELVGTAIASGFTPVEVKHSCPRAGIPTLQQYVTMSEAR